MPVLLENLTKGRGPLTQRQLKQLQAWVDEDWEAADLDRSVVTVIRRLLLTVKSMDTRLDEEETKTLMGLIKRPARAIPALVEAAKRKR